MDGRQDVWDERPGYRDEADTEMNKEHLSGGDALRGNTRSHPEHDG